MGAGVAGGAREPLEACGGCFVLAQPAQCAPRQLAAGPQGNCVGGEGGQDMAFAIRSGTDLATGIIASFGALYAGHLLKSVADSEPSNSYKLG